MKGEFARAVNRIADPKMERILLLTGFPCVKPEVSTICQESDGPPGIISLAIALGRLNKKVTFTTNINCAPVMIHLKSWLDERFSSLDIDYFTTEPSCVIDWKNYDHLVSIETAGISADGKCYTMSGRDITKLSLGLSEVVLDAIANSVPVTAVGDGGNETGMGKEYNLIIKNSDLAKKIASTVACDNLIVAGVSNWGGDALGVGCSIISGDLCHVDAKTHHEIMQETVKAGSRDGVTCLLEESVDGFSYGTTHKQIYNEMLEVYNSS